LYKKPKFDAIGCRRNEKLTSRQQTNVPKHTPYPPSTILDRLNTFVKLPTYFILL